MIQMPTENETIKSFDFYTFMRWFIHKMVNNRVVESQKRQQQQKPHHQQQQQKYRKEKNSTGTLKSKKR